MENSCRWHFIKAQIDVFYASVFVQIEQTARKSWDINEDARDLSKKLELEFKDYVSLSLA